MIGYLSLNQQYGKGLSRDEIPIQRCEPNRTRDEWLQKISEFLPVSVSQPLVQMEENPDQQCVRFQVPSR